ncbi:alpha/beta fold hydrolase [Halomonas sp. DP5Y7-2]|uniref:alpha/beta fold hydrolase n=1 Tax=Halomonas sp. DP5Y7-2 TaxID=2859076 RepID=UPI001C99F6EE|nr:alpha/beta fold hydrolase [Halomonas sp. DP5Y7-2]MBY5985602.1 alpha/beta fold hydrolase [Halomonas sp. DP5Y7-2]
MSFAKIHHRTLSYRLLGSEALPLLVLAHPLGMNQSVWDELLPRLISRYRVLTWDLPGHGASGPLEPGGAITPQDLADELLALLAEVGIADTTRLHFVGTSIGGVIGQALIAHHPERLASASLTNTGAQIGNLELWSARAGRVRAEGLAAMSGEIVPRWFAARAFEANSALAPGWQLAMGRGDDESYAQLCEMLGQADFRGRLGDAGHHPPAFRVNLLAGSEDLATPPASLAALAEHIPGAELTVFDGVGHVPSVEAPQRLCDWLLDALAPELGDVAEHGVAYSVGIETRKQVLGEAHVARSTAKATSLDAPFQQMITRLAWGELWSNDDLTRRERSMITTGILAALGREELTLHLNTAQRIGLSEAELRQVLMHVAIYAGVPAANHAFALAKELGWGACEGEG